MTSKGADLERGSSFFYIDRATNFPEKIIHYYCECYVEKMGMKVKIKNRNGVQARINIILVVVIGLLSACTDQAALKPVQATDTATALPSTTLLPTFTPTVTSTPLSPDAQALKDIVFSDCIPVDIFYLRIGIYVGSSNYAK